MLEPEPREIQNQNNTYPQSKTKTIKKGRPPNSKPSSSPAKRLPKYMYLSTIFLKFFDNIQMPKRLVFPNEARSRLIKKFSKIQLQEQDIWNPQYVESLIKIKTRELSLYKQFQNTGRLSKFKSDILLIKNCFLEIAEMNSREVVPEVLDFFARILNIVTENFNNTQEMKSQLRQLGNLIADSQNNQFIFLGLKFFDNPKLFQKQNPQLNSDKYPENQFVLNPKFRNQNGEFAKFTVNLGLFALEIMEFSIQKVNQWP